MQWWHHQHTGVQNWIFVQLLFYWTIYFRWVEILLSENKCLVCFPPTWIWHHDLTWSKSSLLKSITETRATSSEPSCKQNKHLTKQQTEKNGGAERKTTIEKAIVFFHTPYNAASVKNTQKCKCFSPIDSNREKGKFCPVSFRLCAGCLHLWWWCAGKDEHFLFWRLNHWSILAFFRPIPFL